MNARERTGGRRNAGRHLPERRGRERSHLCNGSPNICVRLEKNLNHRNSGQRLRFNVLDVVDRRGQVSFVTGHDPVGHVLRRKPRIVPKHADNGNVDVGENIRGCSEDGSHPNNQNQQRDNNKSIGPA